MAETVSTERKRWTLNIRRWAALLLMMSILCTAAQAEIVPIPMDQDIMEEVQEKYYVSETEYEDPSIHVKLEFGDYLNTRYVVSRIKIADPSQIRAYTTGGKSLGKYPQYGTDIAKKVHSVFCLSGDVVALTITKKGRHIERMGKTWLSKADGTIDCMIIDDKGDLHVIERATEEDIAAFEGNIVSTYSFGPVLIMDGEQRTDFSYRASAIGGKKPAQRICIGQTGPLEYIVVCCAGPDQKNEDGSKCRGLTVNEFADLVYSVGDGDIQIAYNLDGGSSSWVVFQEQKVNAFGNRSRRAIADVIYFASAYQED